MTWFRVDDGFGEHRKVDSLGSETPHALCVWLLCGNASARALTDGHVSEAMLSRSCSTLSPTMRRRAVAALVKAGLWEERDDGWRFHDWLDHQPSRDLVVAEREKARERQRKHRASLAGVSHAVTDGVTSSSVTRPRPGPSRPVPTFSEPERESARVVAKPPSPGPFDRQKLKEAIGRQLIREFGAEYKKRRGCDWIPSPHTGYLYEVADALLSQPDPSAAATRLIAAVYADTRRAEKGWPWRWIAADLGELLARPGDAEPDVFPAPLTQEQIAAKYGAQT